MKPGDRVSAKVFGNKNVERIVVQLIDNTVVICTQEEWKAAHSEMRNPTGVGFPVRDVKPLSAHK
jgi:hypothetical protein